MFEKDSPQDLLLRGFSREYILDKTAVDVGYHGNAMKKDLKGIDRVAYKIEFVKSNYTNDGIAAVLDEYAEGIDAATVLDRLGLAGVNIIKLNVLFKGLGLTDEFKEADKKHRKGVMKQGMLDKYGVDNPFKLDEFQAIAAETRKEKYGAEYTLASGSALRDAARETFAEHMADDEFRKKLNEKKCATNMALYGVPYVAQSPVFQAKTRATNLRRYGYTHAMKSPSMRKRLSQVMKKNAPMIAAKSRKTCLEKYGVEYYGQTAEARNAQSERMRANLDVFMSKSRASMLKRYGVKYSWESATLRSKAQATMRERYGSSCYVQSDEYKERLDNIMDKVRNTNMMRYGAPVYTQSDEYKQKVDDIQDKIQSTMRDMYGSSVYTQSEDYKQKVDKIVNKMRDTNISRYGVQNYTQSEDYKQMLDTIAEKSRDTNISRYGAPFYVQSDEYKQKVDSIKSKRNATKRKNGTFNTSSTEERIKVLGIFEPQYNKDSRYPYLCDFYDKDRDLFIEVNASWVHGCHWYDIEKDANLISSWQAKSTDSKYYSHAVKVFTQSDVKKRNTARANNLNYVILWDSDGMDADLWLAMGMPLGKDYKHEYSWLPYHYIPEEVDVSKMRISWSRLSAIVKDAQRKVFYKRELELWNENPLRNGKWGTVQAFLYANRYKYLNKLPHELTDRMLLRAFRISGLHMGYTSFNSALMRQVIEKYNVKSVYDPCAGWGERMMTCGKLGVSYEGCDINAELFTGYEKLAKLIDGFKPVLYNNDSANQLVTGDADAIITCPPYKGIEVYSENGAENLSDEDFAAWWGDVVKNCSYSKAKVFAVQTNQACRGVFKDALVAHGWQFKEELLFDNNQKSHFHRSNGNDKHEYESMLVFVR
jgi:hypothetical protein